MSDNIAQNYPQTVPDDPHDVLLTPFMVRVREALSGGDDSATLVFRRSRPELIAVAIDEWFALRARAEQVISEANAMFTDGGDHIFLDDEYGTGHLSFTLSWRDRSVRVAVDRDDLHSGHVVTEASDFLPVGEQTELRPDDEEFLENLAVSLVSIHQPQIHLSEEKDT